MLYCHRSVQGSTILFIVGYWSVLNSDQESVNGISVKINNRRTITKDNTEKLSTIR